MRVQLLHSGLIMPTKATDMSAGYDIYMPEDGSITGMLPVIVGLGFAAEVPPGCVALLLPRSSSGVKFGLELNNTCGVIDSDYRGEWKAAIKTKTGLPYYWSAGDRLLQFLIMPVISVNLTAVASLEDTERGIGGFGSTGT